MLGCHDFCGHYEWTFHYVRRRWGLAAIHKLWALAIGGESQSHYAQAAQQAGLRGLYETWTKTGQDESCDWTFTLDEKRNVLRCDMRACPSKGFLLQNDRNADEDYCDHCMGWVIPLLDRVGAEVTGHEHNHAGQCWMTLGQKGRPSEPLELEIDIRRDPRWNHGYLDRWTYGRKEPLLPEVSDSDDPCEVLEAWLAKADGAVLVSDATYTARTPLAVEPAGALIGDTPDLAALARRYLATSSERRPLLLHAYLPQSPKLDFVSHHLPRPLPILPLLIRRGLYTHRPAAPHPTADEFLALLARAAGRVLNERTSRLRLSIPQLASPNPKSIPRNHDMSPKAILIIGVGSIGQRHVRCFQATGRARIGICEVNPSLREQVAKEYGVEKAYGSLEEALGDRYDAALIATPANLHIPMAFELSRAGLHLLIEKPLSTSLDRVDELVAARSGKDLVTAVAYVLRAHPSLQAMREAILSGRFGRPVEVLTYCGQHFPTYRPAYREIYYKSRATGGGAIQDAITHHLNAGEWLAGPIDRLMADAAHQVLDGVEVEDTVHVITRQGNVLGSYTLNQYQAPSELTISVVCTEGTARWESHQRRWRWMVQPDGTWHDEPIANLERDDLFIGQANAFLDAIEGLRPPLCTLEEGVQTLRVNLAVLDAVEHDHWQTLQTIDKTKPSETTP